MDERRQDYPMILTKLEAHADLLSRIDERQKGMCADIKELKDHAVCDDHGLRISSLERWRSWINGALAVIGGTGTIVIIWEFSKK